MQLQRLWLQAAASGRACCCRTSAHCRWRLPCSGWAAPGRPCTRVRAHTHTHTGQSIHRVQHSTGSLGARAAHAAGRRAARATRWTLAAQTSGWSTTSYPTSTASWCVRLCARCALPTAAATANMRSAPQHLAADTVVRAFLVVALRARVRTCHAGEAGDAAGGHPQGRVHGQQPPAV
jgi:hypothetical protein